MVKQPHFKTRIGNNELYSILQTDSLRGCNILVLIHISDNPYFAVMIGLVILLFALFEVTAIFANLLGLTAFCLYSITTSENILVNASKYCLSVTAPLLTTRYRVLRRLDACRVCLPRASRRLFFDDIRHPPRSSSGRRPCGRTASGWRRTRR